MNTENVEKSVENADDLNKKVENISFNLKTTYITYNI
jgi:hypothetical protein